jgi:3',5'-cyclic AMP phosphodiesterase CpdA
MKRLFLAGAALLLIVGAVALSDRSVPAPRGLQVQVQGRNPWTHLRLNNAADVFRFAIVSDRTGGHRAGVFARAVEQLNWLQPEFVLSVGDLIEGAKKEQVPGEWKEFQGFVDRLQMPFFYVPGNHDYGEPPTTPAWRERFGRGHYHFVYKGVLFLVLNSNVPGEKGKLGTRQVLDTVRTLRAYPSARWTIVLLHHALWAIPAVDRSVDGKDWLAVEKALAGRKYTVFCGHGHTYRKWVRQGMNYYMLGTTGGASGLSGPSYGSIDHVTWVTMKPDGPVLANLLLDGIYPEDLRLPMVKESAGSGYDPRTIPWPRLEVKVLLDGKPAAGKLVFLHRKVGAKPPEKEGTLLGYVRANGTVAAWIDRWPAGEYAVTVIDYTGRFAGRPADAEVRALRSAPVSKKYARPATSGLTVRVSGKRDNVNRSTLDLHADRSGDGP